MAEVRHRQIQAGRPEDREAPCQEAVREEPRPDLAPVDSHPVRGAVPREVAAVHQEGAFREAQAAFREVLVAFQERPFQERPFQGEPFQGEPFQGDQAGQEASGGARPCLPAAPEVRVGACRAVPAEGLEEAGQRKADGQVASEDVHREAQDSLRREAQDSPHREAAGQAACRAGPEAGRVGSSVPVADRKAVAPNPARHSSGMECVRHTYAGARTASSPR